MFLTKLSFTPSEISPAEDQDLGRLLLLYLWSSDLQRGPRCLLHYDGPGHGGSHLVSSQLLSSLLLIKLICFFKTCKSLDSSWFICISHIINIIIITLFPCQVCSRENPDKCGHESGRAQWYGPGWRSGPEEMAVRCLVHRCHCGQQNGSWRNSWVRTNAKNTS